MKIGDIVRVQHSDKKILGKVMKFMDDDKCLVQYKKWDASSGKQQAHNEVFKVDDVEEI